jgi:TPR repeat protein
MLIKVKKPKQFFAAAAFALVIASPAFSADINQITDALKKGDFSLVKSDLIPLAESGDARAQFNLGVSYKFGNGVEKDLQKSYHWTLKAAENGETRAEVNLASMYVDGAGTPRNVPTAIGWYEKAAAAGDVNAELALAKIYRDGIGGKVDYAKAFEYYSTAADKGSSEARFNLAGFYHYGLGVIKNEDKAQTIFASLKQPASPAVLNSYSTAAGETAK